jgi:hypothetical protein
VKNSKSFRSKLSFFCLALILVQPLCLPFPAEAQVVPYARTFPKPQGDVEAALKELQAYSGQRLPIVDGFVAVSGQPLDRYERAFYQFSIELVSNGSDSTVVKLSAKITTWYADPDPSKSGYQVLPSNGRLEMDLLDRLSEKFGGKSPIYVPRSVLQTPRPKIDPQGNALSENPLSPGRTADSSVGSPATTSSPNLTASEIAALKTQREGEQKHMLELKSELEGLQEIQHNQTRPRNLVIVKKSGSPVLSRPVEGAKVLFAASVDDEFEFIETQGEWFHVQIAGAARGWIRRSEAESMDPRWNAGATAAKADAETGPVFKVTREEIGQFQGDWAPLKGLKVKIFWVQPVASPTASTSPGEKREFTKSLFQRAWGDSKQAQNAFVGVVVVFDAPDGGQISTTMTTLQGWLEGKTSEVEFWRQGSIDPPELFSMPLKH